MKLLTLTLLLAAVGNAQPGQLVFGVNTGDKVTANAAASINDLNPFTIVMWVYPTTITNNRRFFNKGIGSSCSSCGFIVGQIKTSGFVELDVARATTDTDYISSSLGMTTNKWYFVAMTYNSASTPTTHFYIGDLNTIAAEPTYSTSTNGTGSVKAQDTNQKFTFFNRDLNGNAFQGSGSTVGVWNVVLTQTQVRAIQQQWTDLPSGNVLTFGLGGPYGTSSQTDLSGNSNTGTVTTATLGVGGVPLAVPAILGVM